jgi:hypothetical protein
MQGALLPMGPVKSFSGKKMQENILRDNPPQREQYRYGT